MAGKTIFVALALAFLAVNVAAVTETITGLGGTCRYQLSAEVNTTHAVIRTNGSTTNTKCPVINPLFKSFFANDTVQLETVYKSNTPKEASLTATPGNVGSKVALDGGACLQLPANVTGYLHICQFEYLNTPYHLAVLTTQPDGGEFNANVTEILEPAVNTTDVFVVQQSGTNSSNEIHDQTAKVILASNNSVAALSGLRLSKAVIKTKYLPDYKVVDFATGDVVRPFANPLGNGTYDAGFTFETIVKGTESTCFLVGCDLTLILVDESTNRLAVVRTTGFETDDWSLTGLAIGVIIAIIIAVLVLCSCICCVVYFCRKRSGEHQPLREH